MSEQEVADTKARLLEQLEVNARDIAGQVIIHHLGLISLDLGRVEKCLREIMDAIVELKGIEGVPTSLRKVNRS